MDESREGGCASGTSAITPRKSPAESTAISRLVELRLTKPSFASPETSRYSRDRISASAAICERRAMLRSGIDLASASRYGREIHGRAASITSANSLRRGSASVHESTLGEATGKWAL